MGPDVEGNETGASGTRPRISGSSATADSGAEGGMAESAPATGPGILVLERGGEEGVRAVANLTGRAISLAGLELGGGDLLLSTEDERYGGARRHDHSRNESFPHELLIFGSRGPS